MAIANTVAHICAGRLDTVPTSSLADQISGRSNSIGGAIVDSIPQAEHKRRFKRLNEPDVSYHGVVYTRRWAPQPTWPARVVAAQHGAATISPFNGFHDPAGHRNHWRCGWAHLHPPRRLPDTRGSPAGGLRCYAGLEAANSNRWPIATGRANVPGHLSFGIKGGRGGRALIDALQLVTWLVNIGDAKSPCHPASFTTVSFRLPEMAGWGQRRHDPADRSASNTSTIPMGRYRPVAGPQQS